MGNRKRKRKKRERTVTTIKQEGKSVNTTPQMTRFRGAKECSKWLQERIDDHIKQSDYKYKNGLKERIQYWYVVLAW